MEPDAKTAAGREDAPSPANEPPIIGAPRGIERGASPVAADPAKSWVLVLAANGRDGVEPVSRAVRGRCAVSFLDDSLILFCGLHVLSLIRGLVSLPAFLVYVGIYGLMALAPMIPKRLFLPLTLFNPVAGLVGLPFLIFSYSRIQQITWGISLGQVIVALCVLFFVQGGATFRWPPMTADRLETRRFSWRHLFAFLLVNVFVLVPSVLVYVACCAALAVDHFSDGFMALHATGFTVQVRQYARDDGKIIQLVPMSHIGDPTFYRTLSESFPTNSTVLCEGVSDERNLLTNGIDYERLATSLGAAEQKSEFKPRGQLVRADVDVEQFTASTIDFLNLAMLFHSKGLNHATLMALLNYTAPPHLDERLIDDLLTKRNRHLLDQIEDRLSQSERIIVPWGVAHMPGIAKEIRRSRLPDGGRSGLSGPPLCCS